MKIGSKKVRVLLSQVLPHPSCCFYAKGRWKGQSTLESVARGAHWASFRHVEFIRTNTLKVSELYKRHVTESLTSPQETVGMEFPLK